MSEPKEDMQTVAKIRGKVRMVAAHEPSFGVLSTGEQIAVAFVCRARSIRPDALLGNHTRWSRQTWARVAAGMRVRAAPRLGREMTLRFAPLDHRSKLCARVNIPQAALPEHTDEPSKSDQ
jgi:hypothetical protein